MGVLHIFDFDDTLVNSKSKVRISHADGSSSELQSSEYATYDEKPGDVMDFSDFDSYPQEAEIIEDVFSELSAAIEKDGIESVVILTARAEADPVREFMEHSGISNISVHAVGSSDPKDKAKYVLERLKEKSVNLIRVFEDNARNLREIRKVVRKNGEVKLQTYRVVDGEIFTR